MGYTIYNSITILPLFLTAFILILMSHNNDSSILTGTELIGIFSPCTNINISNLFLSLGVTVFDSFEPGSILGPELFSKPGHQTRIDVSFE